MSYELERSLIETRFKAAMPSGAAIQFANTPFQPPAGGFARITVLSGGGSGLLALTGGTQRRYGGIIDVGIFIAPDIGTKGLREQADLVEAALAHQALASGSTRIITFGSDFKDLGRMGDWYQGNVTVRFQRDQT